MLYKCHNASMCFLQLLQISLQFENVAVAHASLAFLYRVSVRSKVICRKWYNGHTLYVMKQPHPLLHIHSFNFPKCGTAMAVPAL